MSSDNAVVTSTWKLISGDLMALGEVFYTNLFTDYPDLKSTLYKNVPMKVQAIRLMHMVDTCIGLLERPAVLLEELFRLGGRHFYYGVTEVHYPWIGDALIKTLGIVLKEKFTDDVKAAWARTYGVITWAMLKGTSDAALREKQKAEQAAAGTVGTAPVAAK